MAFKRNRVIVLVAFALISLVGITVLQKYSQNTIMMLKSTKAKDDSAHPETVIASCGEICSYGGTNVDNTGAVPMLYKNINCDNIIQRMAYRHHNHVYPPPQRPPDDLYDEFTMFGKMPIKSFSYSHYRFNEDKVARVSSAHLQELIGLLERAENINRFKDGICVQKTLEKFKSSIEGRRVVVSGTHKPWLEAILLAHGAENITSLEYRKIQYENPQLEAYSPYTFAEKFLRGEVEQFDFGATFSSLEHAGLGRYTDPLNPYADMEVMAQVWCMTKPGGMFAVGVPGNTTNEYNTLTWNTYRRYGPERLQQLLANWEQIYWDYCARHHFVVLRKPTEKQQEMFSKMHQNDDVI